MKWEKSEFLAERAEKLAIVYLTRRNDLVVRNWSRNGATPTLLVTLTREGKETGRMFAVETIGLESCRQVERFDTKNLFIPEDLPFPVCLFVFSMEDDSGHYKWLVKPVYGPENRSLLRTDRTDALKPLSTESIGEIVAEVNGWYENKIKIPA